MYTIVGSNNLNGHSCCSYRSWRELGSMQRGCARLGCDTPDCACQIVMGLSSERGFHISCIPFEGLCQPAYWLNYHSVYRAHRHQGSYIREWALCRYSLLLSKLKDDLVLV
jgi:hypothetical protein